MWLSNLFSTQKSYWLYYSSSIKVNSILRFWVAKVRTSWGLPGRQCGLFLFSIKMGWNMMMDSRAPTCPWKWTGKHCRKENTHRLDKCSDPWLVSCSLLWTPAPCWPILIHVQQTKYSLLSSDIPVISLRSVWWSIQKHRCETKVRFISPSYLCLYVAFQLPPVSLIPSHCSICYLLTTIRLNYTSGSFYTYTLWCD